MALVSDLLGKIKPSPTLSLIAKANELKAQGKDVIGLSAVRRLALSLSVRMTLIILWLKLLPVQAVSRFCITH